MLATLEPHTVIDGRYEVIRILGSGGFGDVYEATDLVERRTVAVKLLKQGEDDWRRRRFEVEARALQLLDHPNCAGFHGAGLHGAAPYVVTEFVDGETLAQWLGSEHPMEELLDVARQMAGALAHAHRHNIVHRDLKPDNILVVADRGWTVKVVDFGIAKLVGTEQGDITVTGEMIGTAGYMSPEQLRGRRDIGPPTDMYCLGVLLFTMLEGRPPFVAAAPMQVCMQHLTDEPPTLRQASQPIGQLVADLLQKEPASRPTARAAVRVLEFALGRRPSTSAVPIAEHVERPWAVWAVALMVLVAIGAGAYRLASKPGVPARPSPMATLPQQGVAAPTPAPARDAGGAGPVLPALQGSLGCGRGLQSGYQDLRRMDGLEVEVLLGYIPDPYDPVVPHPLIIALHEGNQSPGRLLEELALEELADANGIVVVAPLGERPMKGSWKVNPAGIVANALALAMDDACIDRDRVFLLGHGVGSRAAQTTACAMDVRGVALTTHRLGKGEEICGDRPTPTLLISVRDDFAAPGCDTHNDMTHPSMVAAYQKGKQCLAAAKRRRELPHGICHDWSCDVPFTTCAVEGGQHWAAGYGAECDGPASRFDYRTEIWAFFEGIRPAGSASDF